jgi:hypothetical protein
MTGGAPPASAVSDRIDLDGLHHVDPVGSVLLRRLGPECRIDHEPIAVDVDDPELRPACGPRGFYAPCLGGRSLREGREEERAPGPTALTPEWIRWIASVWLGYGTPVTDSQKAAVSMPAAPAQLSIPSPLSMTGSPVSVMLSP